MAKLGKLGLSTSRFNLNLGGGPKGRLLRQVLVEHTGKQTTARLILDALCDCGLEAIPNDDEGAAAFLAGPLSAQLRAHLSPDALAALAEDLPADMRAALSPDGGPHPASLAEPAAEPARAATSPGVGSPEPSPQVGIAAGLAERLEPLEPPDAPGAGHEAGEAQGPTALLALLEGRWADLLEDELQARGYRTVRVHDGYRALDQGTQLQPDVLLTDARLPTLTGGQLAALLRGRLQDAMPPVIVMDDLGATLAEEVDVVLSRTTEVTQVADAVERALTARTARS